MTENPTSAPELRSLVLSALARVAPDVDTEELDDEAPLRADLELDSLDFLGFVEELGRATGRRIEEADYDRLTTVASTVAFLERAPA
jgi:acyl carrier protein